MEKFDLKLIIGLDLSLTSTGISIYNILEDVFTSEAVKTSNKYSYVERYKKILDRIIDIDHFLEPGSFFFIEGYSFGSFGKSTAMSNLIELGGIIKFDVVNRGRQYIDIPPTILKKFITGRGNAKKEDIKLGIYKKYQREFKTSDEADAFALAVFGVKYLEIPTTQFGKLTLLEKECIDKVKTRNGEIAPKSTTIN
jgi:crossover junction endodeoxyribonuclease RuvC